MSSIFNFNVRPFTDDVTGHLSAHTLGKQLLECAGLHANMHGFGYEQMKPQHRAWVLSRLVIECNNLPATGEDYQIDTFVNKIYRQFTDRMFIVSSNDEVCAYGFSTWALIDFESRVPVNLDELPDGGFREVLSDRSIPIAPPARIRVKAGEPIASHTAAFSDLDVNGHVNSIRYIDLLLDISIKNIEKRVKRIDIAYAHEAMMGDNMEIFAQPSDTGMQYEIRLQDGTVLAKAEITLQ